MNNPVVLLGEVEASTKKAVLFKGHEMAEAVWLPRSQCEIEDMDGEWRVAIPGWLAEKNGIEEVS